MDSQQPKQYVQYTFDVKTSDHEIMIAFLSQYPFESFEEKVDQLLGWIQEKLIPEDFEGEIKDSIPLSFDFNAELVKNENWNHVWESQFDPVYVDDFCVVRADFHTDTRKCTHEIVINPKMAFGTGHHETTEMMIRQMAPISFEGKTVFDFGTGTGILAILAKMLKSTHIVGIDNDMNAVENAIENIKDNQVSDIDISIEDITSFTNTNYDIVFANVNRNAILAHIDDLEKLTKPNGIVLVSGILQVDKIKIQKAFASAGFQLKKRMEKGEWLCFLFTKN